MRMIRISTDKVGKRAERIESVQLEDAEEGERTEGAIATPLRSSGED